MYFYPRKHDVENSIQTIVIKETDSTQETLLHLSYYF